MASVDEGGVHLQLRYEGDVARVADDHLEEQLAMAQLVQPSTFSGCSPHGVRPTATAYAMSTPPARRMPTRCAKSCTMRQRALQRLPRLGTELQTPGRRPRRWPERFAILCHVRRPGHADSGGKHNGHASCRFADMGPVLEVIGFTLPAVAVAAAAGAIAGWRPPGQRLTSAIQHLAAGIVFAAAALELLPKERHAAAVPVALGFGIGLVLMLGLRVLANRLEARDAGGRLPAGLIVVTGIDLLVDGIVLGIGFAAGEQTGVLLAAALTLEVLFVSLAVGAAMSQGSAGQLGTLLMPPALMPPAASHSAPGCE